MKTVKNKNKGAFYGSSCFQQGARLPFCVHVQIHASDANLISEQNYIGLYKYRLPLNSNKNS